MDYEKEIPFGAFDSELMYQEIFIPEGFEAEIKGDKIILKKIESEDEKIRKDIISYIKAIANNENISPDSKKECKTWIAWLEKQEGCEYIKKDWLEHIKQSWYKEGFIDGKYTPKELTINDAATLNELIDFLENGTVKLQHDLTLYANWLKTQFSTIEKQGEQKPQRMISAEAKEAMYNKLACVWSEEDECYMSECIGAIATKDGWSFEEKRKTKHWLKSLKQRIGGEQ